MSGDISADDRRRLKQPAAPPRTPPLRRSRANLSTELVARAKSLQVTKPSEDRSTAPSAWSGEGKADPIQRELKAAAVTPAAHPMLRAWKRLPSPFRHTIHSLLHATWRASTPWLVGSRWRRGRPGGAPVAVAGLLRSSIGIGAGARLFLDALREGQVPACGIDAGPWIGAAGDLTPDQADAPLPRTRTVISHINPPELERALRSSRGRLIGGRRHIGYWAWESPQAPGGWRSAFRYVDEVWTPSRFCADALHAIAPKGIPVRVVPHPVCAGPVAAPDREGFDLPAGACVTFAALDLKSTAARKNPQGVLEIYARAVPRPTPGSLLICKISGRLAEPSLFAQLEAQAQGRPDIRLITTVLTQSRMSALIASSDVVLSPHRAEGFGLVLAEAMRLGKAVVATGWSGNMDFMDEECAALIPFTLTPIADPQGMYSDALWAEPDLDQAVALLSDLIADPAARSALGRRAAARIAKQFDTSAWVKAVERGLSGASSRRRTLWPAQNEDRTL